MLDHHLHRLRLLLSSSSSSCKACQWMLRWCRFCLCSDGKDNLALKLTDNPAALTRWKEERPTAWRRCLQRYVRHLFGEMSTQPPDLLAVVEIVATSPTPASSSMPALLSSMRPRALRPRSPLLAKPPSMQRPSPSTRLSAPPSSLCSD
ncbi:hypothetical protein GUJ93_ZPchr0011g27817 [Zizania palustris]|uniref:Uncharacterized protein n=1 Tax=Zizania palustris TaxID=103762 RepID=A0A8J6BNH4_ZIZPA|nr:hypothetical protein GUJ93_ZPchr0011g27817 [Zizania palustris]